MLIGGVERGSGMRYENPIEAKIHVDLVHEYVRQGRVNEPIHLVLARLPSDAVWDVVDVGGLVFWYAIGGHA